MTMQMIPHCEKTGAHWPCKSQAHGDALAATKGLKDYTITAAGKAPATIRETIEAQLARRQHNSAGAVA